MTTPEISQIILTAAASGDVEQLKSLTNQHGAALVRLDLDADELTALHWAAASGDLPTVQFLLAPPVSADACAARKNNFTPLHSAAMHGHASICELLIAEGADVNVQTDPQGYAPLHSAAFAGHVDAIRTLLQHGADPTRTNYRNERPVDTARRTDQTNAIALLSPP